MKQDLYNGMKHVNVSVNLEKKICNNKQRWNKDKCRCECKELIDEGVCDKGFIWNASDYKCEYDTMCDIGEYLEYENCKCRKRLVDKLFHECTETIEEVKLAKITLAENESEDKCSSCTGYIVLIILVFYKFYFVYYDWFLIKNNVSCIKFGTHTETKIW